MKKLRELFSPLLNKRIATVDTRDNYYAPAILGTGGKLAEPVRQPPEPGSDWSEFRYISAKGIILNHLTGRDVKVKCHISGLWRTLRVETTDLKYDTFYVKGKYVDDGSRLPSCTSEYNCNCNDPDFVTDWIPEQDICVNVFW